jgi:C1A family cysteine protease
MIRVSAVFGRISRVNMVVCTLQPVSSIILFIDCHRFYIDTILCNLDQEKQRFRVFRDHLKYVLESNLQKLRSFQLELNEFADWTLEEFNSMKKGLVISTGLRRQIFEEIDHDRDSVRRSLDKLHQRHHHARRSKRNLLHSRNNNKFDNKRGFTSWLWNLINTGTNTSNTSNTSNNAGQSQTSFDWRSKNVIGSVKNQLNCGCCYAFATASILESLYAIKTKSKTVTEFSPQQITDCSANGNNGCNGGNFPPSIRYIMGQGGSIATLASYPYAGQKQACKTSGLNNINLGNIQFGGITEGDEKALAEALVNYGPIFIGLDADSKLFMFYKSGILSINNCPTRRQDMDHAMVVVGYGYDKDLKMSYWIIKNSWAEKWGENGYFRLAKDKSNMCGVASMAYFAKLA